MNQPSIEEKLKAIEAAIALAQSRQLPVVRQQAMPAAMPGSLNDRDPAKSREMVLAILSRFDDRIAFLERDGAAHQHTLSQTTVTQQEHREVIELIGDEVAQSLKQRTAEMEAWLRSMHVRDTVHLLQSNQHEWRRGARLIWGIAIGAVLALLTLVYFSHWG